MLRRFSSLVFILILLLPVFTSGKEYQDSTDISLILDVLSCLDFDSIPEAQEDTMPDYVSVLIGSIRENEKDTVEDNISFIVRTFYGKNEIPEKTGGDNVEDVLGFMTEAYSEHDFHETGSWVKPSRGFRYIPYKGELPDYTLHDFIMPVKGKFTSSYGYRINRGRFHHGIDIAVNYGDTVRCVLPGVVTRIGHDKGGYGNYVVVAHSGGVETLYGHLSAPTVTPGDKLNPGDALGLGGSTGNSTGPHLHFETRRLGVPMDPVSWFNLEDLLR